MSNMWKISKRKSSDEHTYFYRRTLLCPFDRMSFVRMQVHKYVRHDGKLAVPIAVHFYG